MENNDVEPNNVPGEVTPSSNPTETPDAPQLSKEEKSKLESFDRIYAEKKALEDKLKALQVNPVDNKLVPKEPGKTETFGGPGDPIELAKFSKEAGQYSEDELEFATKLAPTKDLDGIRKAFKDPMFQVAIQAQREKVKKENNIPKPSSPGSTMQSDFETEMAEARKSGDVQAIVEKKIAELKAKGGSGEGI